MPTLTAISREQHGNKRWLRPSTYSFAAGDAVIPLVEAELPKAAMTLPLAFISNGEGFVPAAVLGLVPGQNLFVAPTGQWQGYYIPAIYRTYPFQLAKTAEGREVLCIREDSGLVTDAPEAEAFFTSDGQPTPSVATLLDFLQQISRSGQMTQRICGALQTHGIIQPWAITLQTPVGEKKIDGLHRIDEAALNALPDRAFLELRAGGALTVAYCQLLSMQHLSALGQVASARADSASASPAAVMPVTPRGELDLDFLQDNGMLDFSRLN
jgi:hypothetical protein